QAQLEEAGVRSHLDDRKEKVNLKIRDAQLQKVPYMLVVGEREAEAGAVAVRHRNHGDLGAKPVEAFIAEVRKLVDTKAVAEYPYRWLVPPIRFTEARTILSRTSGFIAEAGFTHSLTPARNCTFGCTYCYVPTMRVQGGLKPEDWQRWGQFTTIKANAADL